MESKSIYGALAAYLVNSILGSLSCQEKQRYLSLESAFWILLANGFAVGNLLHIRLKSHFRRETSCSQLRNLDSN